MDTEAQQNKKEFFDKMKKGEIKPIIPGTTVAGLNPQFVGSKSNKYLKKKLIKEYVDMIEEGAKKDDEDFAFRLEKEKPEQYDIKSLREDEKQPMEYQQMLYDKTEGVKSKTMRRGRLSAKEIFRGHKDEEIDPLLGKKVFGDQRKKILTKVFEFLCINDITDI